MERATDKQVKFIMDLAEWYYDASPDKRNQVKELVSKTDKLSKHDASTLIKIMKHDADIKRQAYAIIKRGGCGSNFYAAHVDISDTTDEEKINEILSSL